MTDVRTCAIILSMADLLTTAETAEVLGVSKSTVIYRVRIGELRYAHKSPGETGAYLFDRQYIDQVKATETTAAQQISA